MDGFFVETTAAAVLLCAIFLGREFISLGGFYRDSGGESLVGVQASG